MTTSSSHIPDTAAALEGGSAVPVVPRQATASAGEPMVVPVVEESIAVDKRRIDQGGWRLTKQVTSRDETVDLPLRSLEVTIERRPIDQLLPTMEAPVPRQEGDTWILPVVEEVLVTEKRLRIKEEIRITHTQATHHEPQQISLRSEQVSIERLEPGQTLDIASS